jgi:AcrR family transcriptional regulator
MRAGRLYTVQTVQLQGCFRVSAKPQIRASSRERILDAAAELVRELGSGHLTLDAVAERAGLSKGGLLYNFPSKDALLQGMLERLIAEVTTHRAGLRASRKDARNLEAWLSVTASLETRCGDMKAVANGLLAASAENPRLLEPARQAIKNDWERLKATSADRPAAMLAWLAVEGLSSLEMHDLSPVTKQDRKEIGVALYRLLEKGISE